MSEMELKLANEICNCPLVEIGLKDSKHPCHKIVDWQMKKWNLQNKTVSNSKLHRPEAWTGKLSKAKILFLSSNPGFDLNENFPSWDENDWPIEKVLDFAVNRFSNQDDRKYGATDISNPHGPDRTISKSGLASNKVPHWSWVRRYVALILDKPVSETSAINDYVMTELVHCKSLDEKGVIAKALKTCSDKYFEKILEISPAKLIFIAGTKSGKMFAETYSELVPKDWGKWADPKGLSGQGYWPKSAEELKKALQEGKWNLEEQLKNSVEFEIAGLKRTFIYIARTSPGGPIYSPWSHDGLIHPELLNIWREKLSS